MSDVFYKTIRGSCRIAIATSHRPTVLGRDCIPPVGPLLLAPNHVSWFDIPILVYHFPRILDFVALYALFAHPFMCWFYRNMNCIRYDRSGPDAAAVRAVLLRLRRGRIVSIFPEGKLCAYEHSLFTDQPLRPGVARLAMKAQVAVMPVVLEGTDVYRRFDSWVPFFRARYGIAFGEPLPPPVAVRGLDREEALQRFEAEYRNRMRALRENLLLAMQEE